MASYRRWRGWAGRWKNSPPGLADCGFAACSIGILDHVVVSQVKAYHLLCPPRRPGDRLGASWISQQAPWNAPNMQLYHHGHRPPTLRSDRWLEPATGLLLRWDSLRENRR